jgi:uncharacterized membrane protein
MKIGTKDYIMWLIMLLPFLVIAYYWNTIPDRVPTHWDGAGRANAYGGKYSIFLLPAMSVASYFLIILLPYIDPRKKNYELFKDTLAKIQFLLVAFLSFLGIAVTLMTIGKVKIGPALILNGVCLLILVLGNFMGKVRPNFFVGIKTPWTLSDETVWIRTHRLAGRLWVYCSVVMIVLNFLLPEPNEYLFILYIIIIGALPVAYSYLLYRKLHRGDA